MKKDSLDPYQWSKNRIKLLYEYVKDWQDDVYDSTAKHDVWSIKKLIALSYYIGPFVKIMRANGFKKLCYVDPFSGSGLIKLMDRYRFPGSPLIPLFRDEESHFDKYYLSELKSEYVEILKKRVNRTCIGKGIDVSVSKLKFRNAIENIFSGKKPVRWKDTGYLVFLDPYGFDVDWNSIKRILSSGPVDVIFTFMTWAVVWNRDNDQSQESLNAFFGDPRWRGLKTADDYVNFYCGKIQELGYMNKYKTFTIDVLQDGGRRYDLILASQSPGASNVLTALQKRVKAIDTDLLRGAFSLAVGKDMDLDSFRE